jgi:hypothetical protein
MTGSADVYSEFSTPATDAYEADLVSYYDYSTTVSMVGSNSVTFGAGRIRCDNAPYISLSSGCAFPSPGDFFGRLSVADTTVAVAANHIAFAQYYPDDTIPPKDGPSSSPAARAAARC